MTGLYAERRNLTDKDFIRLSTFIGNELGIKMSDEKRLLLQNRLYKRVEMLKFSSFSDYIDFVLSSGGSAEKVNMIDLVTTNTTHFFREYDHFVLLYNKIVPELWENGIQKIRIWSAGCSSGEEPYSVAMVMEDAISRYPGMNYEIYATDISQTMLKTASDGIYSEDKIKMIPYDVRIKYFLKSRDSEKKLVKISPVIRNKIIFSQLNFMDSVYNMGKSFDIIFCRNVLIYFEFDTQEKIINKLLANLKSNGFYFQGHSESYIGMDLPLSKVTSTVSRRL